MLITSFLIEISSPSKLKIVTSFYFLVGGFSLDKLESDKIKDNNNKELNFYLVIGSLLGKLKIGLVIFRGSTSSSKSKIASILALVLIRLASYKILSTGRVSLAYIKLIALLIAFLKVILASLNTFTTIYKYLLNLREFI